MVRRVSFILVYTAVVSLLALTACEKDFKSSVPDVPVYFQGHLAQPDFSSLTSINNTIKVANYGYRRHGVLVYRYMDDTFYAFDATCPHDLIDGSVEVSKDKPHEVTCPICKKVYSLMNGGISNSGEPLKRYRVTFSGQTITVYN